VAVAPSASVIALGCPKNRVDSEYLLASLGLAGFTLDSDPDSADVIVVTTCGFIRSAVEESEAAVRQALAVKRRRPTTRVIVAGCLVQRYGQALVRRFPGVDLFVGIDRLPDIPAMLGYEGRIAVSPRPSRLGCSRSPRLLSTPPHYAYMTIADGCDNRCSYCLIPDIRGPLRSRPVPDVLAEARLLVEAGVKELVLVAQDTTAYGIDRYTGPALPRLLDRLSALPGLRWLRLMYAHPAHLQNGTIARFARLPNLCRYIDLPIQHVSDRILTLMGRGYLRRDLESMLGQLRSIEDMAIRTTVIVGFPGETEAEFSEMLGFLRHAGFDRLGAYAYSRERGSRAASLPNQVPEPVKHERLRRLMKMQEGISRHRLRRLLGRRVSVQMDTPTTGRTEWDAPEIDGDVRIVGSSFVPGQMLEVRVTRTGTHDVWAEPDRKDG